MNWSLIHGVPHLLPTTFGKTSSTPPPGLGLGFENDGWMDGFHKIVTLYLCNVPITVNPRPIKNDLKKLSLSLKIKRNSVFLDLNWLYIIYCA